MNCVGRNPESDLIEIVEIPGLKWYIGTQFHPEYQSTVLKPHPSSSTSSAWQARTTRRSSTSHQTKKQYQINEWTKIRLPALCSLR